MTDRGRAEALYDDFADKAFEPHAFDKEWWVGIATTVIEQARHEERERVLQFCREQWCAFCHGEGDGCTDCRLIVSTLREQP